MFQNIKRHFNIKYRFLFIFLFIFSVSVVVINLLVSRQVAKNYEDQIQEEIAEQKINAQFYTRQLLVNKELDNNEEGLKKVASELVEEMERYSGARFEIYSLNNECIVGNNIKNNYIKDLQNIKKSKETISFILEGNSKLFVNASFYIIVQDKNIGIMRYNKDYSSIKVQANSITNTFLFVSIVVFIIIFICVQYAVNRMLKPVMELSKNSNEIAKYIQSDNFDSISVDCVNTSNRNDEVGQLAYNYSQMLKKIKEQFKLIKEEKNNIYKLYKYRQDFYNNVTHELKTPLTTIKGYAEILKENGFTDKDFFDKGMNHIIDESERLHKMVIQLLEMSYKEVSDDFVEINLNELIVVVVEAMNLKAKRYGNELIFNNDEICFINGKIDSIKELLINLIDNAIKYGKANRPIIINLLKNNNRIVLEIINEGKGLTKEEKERITEPYYRLDKEKTREEGSAGLGLAICEKIVSNHNGELYVESEIDNYTKFIVEFNKSM